MGLTTIEEGVVGTDAQILNRFPGISLQAKQFATLFKTIQRKNPKKTPIEILNLIIVRGFFGNEEIQEGGPRSYSPYQLYMYFLAATELKFLEIEQ